MRFFHTLLTSSVAVCALCAPLSLHAEEAQPANTSAEKPAERATPPAEQIFCPPIPYHLLSKHSRYNKKAYEDNKNDDFGDGSRSINKQPFEVIHDKKKYTLEISIDDGNTAQVFSGDMSVARQMFFRATVAENLNKGENQSKQLYPAVVVAESALGYPRAMYTEDRTKPVPTIERDGDHFCMYNPWIEYLEFDGTRHILDANIAYKIISVSEEKKL